LKKVIVHSHPLESHWLFPHELVIFSWDLVMKENLYFTTPLLRSLHNGISFAASVRSSLPHVFLPPSLHISLFDCIWPILLQNIMKYSMIQAYVTFQSHHVVFVDVPFSYFQLFGLILAKFLMLAWRWLCWPLFQKWHNSNIDEWLLVLVDPSFMPFSRPLIRLKSMLLYL
jgi:hypothetical protein